MYIRDWLGWELLICPQITQSDKPFWLLQICNGLYLKIHLLPELLIVHMQNYHDFYIRMQSFTHINLIQWNLGNWEKKKKALKSYYKKYGLVPDFLHCFISSKQWFPLKNWLMKKDILTHHRKLHSKPFSLDFVLGRQCWSHHKGRRWTEN